MRDRASEGAGAAPTFEQWWAHFRRSGALAAAQLRLPPAQVAELAAETYRRALAELREREQLGRLVRLAAHPQGVA